MRPRSAERRYEGYWKNGQRNGQGKHTYTEGGCYEGEFLDDRRHGHGKYTYPDGSVFEGDFLYGRCAPPVRLRVRRVPPRARRVTA